MIESSTLYGRINNCSWSEEFMPGLGTLCYCMCESPTAVFFSIIEPASTSGWTEAFKLEFSSFPEIQLYATMGLIWNS
jgi:hypothetical protein